MISAQFGKMTGPCNSPCSNFFKTILNLVVMILSFFLPAGTIDFINNFSTTIPRDLRFLYKFAKVLLITFFYQKSNSTVIDLFDQNVRLYPNKPCFIFEGSEWSFKEVELYSRRVAQAFKGKLVKGDVVGLLVSSRAHYAPIWLGLARLGVISALFNTNQRSRPLIHSLATAKPKVIIFSQDMAQALSEISTDIDPEIELYCLGKTTCMFDYTNLQELISNSDPDYSIGPKINYSDVLLYIYTSGSTGLPKAAIVPHCRYMMVATLARHIIEVTPFDRIYCPLPLYHASGGVLGTASALILGSTTVIKEKFSASSYFKDCIKYNCTVGQHIGETARYILSTPPTVEDKLHSVRLLMGNGLQPEVWKQMYPRFNIPDIVEFYGSTEGNVTLINTENVIGSCGVIPRFIPFLNRFLGILTIKVDINGKPIRNKKGLCVQCKINEPGMVVGMISPGSALKTFYGYVNQEEANKNKYVYDIFKKGDSAFSSGDILVQDKLSYFYFKDRIGDTFRWKGENVATTEVEQVLRGFPKLAECTVYGVQIPGTEGRAGMAAIVDQKFDINVTELAKYLETSLPKYAQPLFIRLVQHFDYTGTYKVKKYNLQKQGFDPNLVKDPLYIKSGSSYVILTLQMFDDVVRGKIHF